MSELTLHATCLLSKWGFGDGDVLHDWAWDNCDRGFDVNVHEVLRGLVRRFLVPAIEDAGHVVEVYDIETIHNPIRASILNGEPVDDRNTLPRHEKALDGIDVTIPAETVLSALESVA